MLPAEGPGGRTRAEAQPRRRRRRGNSARRRDGITSSSHSAALCGMSVHGTAAGNKKRVLRLMREHRWLVPPNRKLRTKWTPTGSKPKLTKPNEWWGIDMAKILVEGLGWVSIVVVPDWYTTKIVGDYTGRPCTSRHWLVALDMAVNRQCPNGARRQDISLMSDNGYQPTSLALMQACNTLGIHQAFTSYSNSQGNAETERIMRTFKHIACTGLNFLQNKRD